MEAGLDAYDEQCIYIGKMKMRLMYFNDVNVKMMLMYFFNCFPNFPNVFVQKIKM